MDNAAIAGALRQVADLLAIQGANPFRVRAYRTAARYVEGSVRPVEKLVAEGVDLTGLPGIGKEIAAHLHQLAESGRLALLDELQSELPPSLIEVVELPGIGPRQARRLWRDAGIETVGQLETAARAGRIATLAGFGRKSELRILAALAQRRLQRDRLPLADADRRAASLLRHLEGSPGVRRLEVEGSYRRRKETVGDLDVLAVASRRQPVTDRFLAYPDVERVQLAGGTRSSVVLADGLRVDLRVVPTKSFGAAQIYFTGSKEHNIKLRQRAIERGLRMSEYGLFRARDGDRDEAGADPWAGEWISGKTERAVYRRLGLPWIPPELREDRGEIEAAEEGRLPRLVETADIRGDLQMHSTWSDGRDSIESMAAGCLARGYEYMAITDHSRALSVANGLDRRRLRLQGLEITRLQERFPQLRILRGVEVEILLDGTLDLDGEVLAELDFVVAAAHSGFGLPSAEQTRRLLRAVENPLVDLLAHPTGRKIGSRPPMEMELEEILLTAHECGVAVELNALPLRLDLKDTEVHLARQLGVRVAIDTDAHQVSDLDHMACGVAQARRGWLEAEDVLNTLPLLELLEFLA